MAGFWNDDYCNDNCISRAVTPKERYGEKPSLIDTLETHVVFLGAGASVPLDFPGSVDVVSQFIEFLKGDQEEGAPDYTVLLGKISKLREQIETNGIDFDSESLYQCLEGYSDPPLYVRMAGPFPTIVCREQPVKNFTADKDCLEIKTLFEEFIIKKYYRSDPQLKPATRMLVNRLLARVIGLSDWKNTLPNWKQTRFEIFTTNYDNVLEIYTDEEGLVPQRGFKIVGGDEIVFTPDEFERAPASINLYKLHGSVELSRLNNGKIISKLPPGLPGESHGSAKVVSKVMVYGIEKNVIAEPYFDLLVRLKKRLLEAKSCTIVGYSFRDPWITQIIKDVAHNLGDFRVTYLSKAATTTLKAKAPFLTGITNCIDKALEEYLELPSADADGG